MSFAVPLGLLLSLSALGVLVLYLLKPKRKTVVVSSVLPYETARRDAAPTSPWQRLKRNPLLWLQVLAALLLGLALARPRLTHWQGGGDMVLLVVDNSTSMATREGRTTRMAQAMAKAGDFLEGLPGHQTVALAITHPRPALLVAPTGNHAKVLNQLRDLRPSVLPGGESDLTALLEQWPERKNLTVVYVGDAAVADPWKVPRGTTVRTITVGTSQANRAIAAAALEPLGNRDWYRLAARVLVRGDEQPFEAVLTLNQKPFRKVTITPTDQGEGVVNERLKLQPGEEVTLLLPGDALALDNRVDLTARAPPPLRVAWVGAENPFLEKALVSLKNVTVKKVASARAARALSPDLTIYEGEAPDAWPQSGASWLLGVVPPGTAKHTVDEAVTIVSPRALMPWAQGLQFKGVTIRELFQPKLPDYFTSALVDSGHTLLYHGRTAQGQMVLFPFSLWSTDMVLSVGFPVLVSRLVEQARAAKVSGPPPLVPLGAPVAFPATGKQATVTFAQGGDVEKSTVPIQGGMVRLPGSTKPGVVRVSGEGWRHAWGTALLNEQEADLSPGRLKVAEVDRSGGAAPAEAGLGKDLFPWVIAVLLVLMASEWWVYHRMKRIL